MPDAQALLMSPGALVASMSPPMASIGTIGPFRPSFRVGSNFTLFA